MDREGAPGQSDVGAADNELTAADVMLVEDVRTPGDGIAGKLTLRNAVLVFQSTATHGDEARTVHCRLTAIVEVALSRSQRGFMQVHSNDGTEAVTFDFGDSHDGERNRTKMARAVRGRMTAGEHKHCAVLRQPV